jgi:ABC-type uncharacterized transport system involved in gliding motility auxiliary subunit
MERRSQSHPYSRLLTALGVGSMIAGLLIMLLLPEIKLAAWGVMAIGAVVLVVALILDFRRVSGALTGRRGRLGAGTTLMAGIFLGITLLVNGISVTTFKRFDTTGLSEFTLTQQTKDVLTRVDQNVTALCFFVPSKDTVGTTSYALAVLSEYQKYTKFLSIKIIDPDERPEQARQYGINYETQYQAVVFESGDKRRLVPQSSILTMDDTGKVVGVEGEHAFTSAILEVTGVAQKKVYFLTGHGEVDPNGNYSAALKGLRDNTYAVDTINLISFPTVPADTAVLVIGSPKKALTAPEVDAISSYLDAGGQALILADPNFPDGLNQIVTSWGVDLENGTVVDPGSSVSPHVDWPLVPSNRDYFSQTLGVPMTVYFPAAVAVKEQQDSSITVVPLAWTSAISWLTTEFDPAKTPVFDKAKDDPGPVAIGVVIASSNSAAQKKLTRIIVIGDSDFASNEHFSQVNNGDLFLNSVNWLAEETQLITLRRAAQPFRRLAINTDQVHLVTYSSLVVPPLLVLLIGAVVWWYRR